MGRIGYHTAGSAVIGYQMGLDITSNNLANVNTAGFKASRADFADLIYTVRNNNIREVQTGHGVKVDKTTLMFDQGVMKQTERKLDFAAMGEGFFAVRSARDDEVRYTKDGAFYIYVEDGTLRDSNGGYVLDYNGDIINVPYKIDKSVPYDENEEEEPVYTEEVDYDALAKMIGVYRFPNPYGVDQVGLNYFEATPSSGEPEAAPDAVKKQGYLELSSTSISNEMAEVIEYQRAFQLNTNVLKIHDELEQKINSLR